MHMLARLTAIDANSIRNFRIKYSTDGRFFIRIFTRWQTCETISDLTKFTLNDRLYIIFARWLA